MQDLDIKDVAKKTRPEIEEYAVSLGLANASTYQNKPTVVDAVDRVRKGEDPAVVDAELKLQPEGDNEPQNDPATTPPEPTITDNDEPGDDADDADDQDTISDDKTAPAASQKAKKERPLVKNKNQGHPTHFDESGAPVYRA